MRTEFDTYRGLVYPWSIDHVGHVNVQSYVGRFDEASWHFLANFGLTPAELRRSDRAVVALAQVVRYKSDVLAGAFPLPQAVADKARTLLEAAQQGPQPHALFAGDIHSRGGRVRPFFTTS
jgi:acyl-CoA thioesterase FadM